MAQPATQTDRDLASIHEARTLARRMREGRLDAGALLDVVDVSGQDQLRTLLAETSIAAADRVALAIAGPAFQWR